jgi:hypothetical protein
MNNWTFYIRVGQSKAHFLTHMYQCMYLCMCFITHTYVLYVLYVRVCICFIYVGAHRRLFD